jgi:CDP-diacylglycerol--glycerol-3-phosphate 3-phosphatidyltransferase
VDKNEFFTTWSKLHGGAKIEGVVKTWLQISYASAKFLSKLRVTPNLLTFAGLFFAIALWQFANSWLAAIFLVLSLFFDGIDGSLAILQKKTSKFGAFTDSFVDRISEFFWALALYKLGAPASLVFVALLATFIQEYLRARSGGLGHSEVGIVTICERPVRASLIFIAIVANLIGLDLVTAISIIWVAMQFIALSQLTGSLYKRLKN